MVEDLTKAPLCAELLSNGVENAEGVYFNIVNVSTKNSQVVKRQDIPDDEDVMFLDMNLTLLNPSIFYTKLLNSIGVETEKCMAKIVGFTRFQRSNKRYTIFPIIEGGSYNPYKKYRSNRVSAFRRFDTINKLSTLTDQKVFLMNFVLTFPKEISKLLFNDPDGVDKANKCHNLFWKRFIDRNLFTIDNKKRKLYKNLQMGLYSNRHDWSSSNPFEPHYHFHDHTPNFLYDKSSQSFVRIKPHFNKQQLKDLQLLWYECQKEVFHYGENLGSIYSEFDISPDKVNFYFAYTNGYKHDMQQPEYKPNVNDPLVLKKYKIKSKEYKLNLQARGRISHILKYSTRTYLVDVGNYFDYHKTDNDQVRFSMYFPYMKKNFKKFVDRGCIQNKTSTKGYLRNLKNITHAIDKKRNTKFYEALFIRKDMVTSTCPVTAQKFDHGVKRMNVFQNISELNVYVAHKSGMLKVSTIQLTKKEENNN